MYYLTIKNKSENELERDKNNTMKSKDLGKYAGQCGSCDIAMGTLEIGKPCSRCGEVFLV
tara:strand:- start:837 stop:1016 length:180 start_codon:yes stop_codon:yes gene_type:complete